MSRKKVEYSVGDFILFNDKNAKLDRIGEIKRIVVVPNNNPLYLVKVRKGVTIVLFGSEIIRLVAFGEVKVVFT